MARYDDGKRGPGVIDSIILSDCWLELAQLDIEWPASDNMRPMVRAMIALIDADYPEGQRQSAKQRALNDEAAMTAIISAIKLGHLPVWIAPIEGTIAERVVAPSAFLELDRKSVIAGCYRPYNDRGWLYGYPLFIKRADWVHFLNQLPRRVIQRLDPAAWLTPSIREREQPISETIARASFSKSAKPTTSPAPKWSEDRMRQEIEACGFTNRDKAWREHFRSRQPEHGWANDPDFRDFWAAARKTKGMTGRPPKRA